MLIAVLAVLFMALSLAESKINPRDRKIQKSLEEQFRHIERECRKNCTEQFTASNNECNKVYQSTKDHCRFVKKEGMLACKNLTGLERSTCVNDVNSAFKACNHEALTTKKQCMVSVHEQKSACMMMCLDLDNDSLINRKDNCPLIANPEQEDSNNNEVGDVCELTEDEKETDE